MVSSSHPDPFEAGDYLGVVRRRWRVVLAAVCLAVLGAAAYVALGPKTYTATAAVYVNANAANANQLAGARTGGAAVNMDNEAQVAQSDTVAGPAARAMHSTVPLDKLIQRITVSVPANTTVLEISCDASTARGAAQCAQAFATSYLNIRGSAARNKINYEIAQLQHRVTTLQAQNIKLSRQQHALSVTSPQHPVIGSQIKTIQAQLSALRSDISALSGSVNYTPGSIITAATPPAAPANPKPLLDIPSGLVAGLLIGLVLAFARDRRDDRIHSAQEMERFFSMPVLLELGRKQRDQLKGLVSPHSEAGRAFTELAEAVGAGLGDGHHIAAVAGASPGEGGALVAANLAAALARTRGNVLLVCADPQDIVTPAMLAAEGPGLAEVVTGRASIAKAACRVPEVARLRVLTPGLKTASLVDKLDYDANERLMADLRRAARYVILAVPAAGEVTDTFGLTEFADAAIVVAEVPGARRADAANCLARLNRMRTIILGCAVLPPIRALKQGRSLAAAPRQDVRPVSASLADSSRPVPRTTAKGRRRVAAVSSLPPGGERLPAAGDLLPPVPDEHLPLADDDLPLAGEHVAPAAEQLPPVSDERLPPAAGERRG